MDAQGREVGDRDRYGAGRGGDVGVDDGEAEAEGGVVGHELPAVDLDGDVEVASEGRGEGGPVLAADGRDDERTTGEGADAELAAPGERVVPGDDDDVADLEDVGAVEAAVSLGEDGEAEVGAAAAHGLDGGVAVLG